MPNEYEEASVIAGSVTGNDEDGYTYQCTRTKPTCGFASTGWGSQDAAEARGAEHEAEHDDPTKTTSELVDFRSSLSGGDPAAVPESESAPAYDADSGVADPESDEV